MFRKEKMKGVRLLITAAVIFCMITACGSGSGKEKPSGETTVQESASEEKESGSESSKAVIPENSILNFNNDKNFARLQSDMKSGNFPVECNVLFDEEGSRPDVTVTDAVIIRNIYGYLADVTVGDKSNLSVTDSYHHVSFRLRNDTYVSFYFEGEDLFCWGNDNYSVSGGQDLWKYVRQLQDSVLSREENNKARENEQANASGTDAASTSTTKTTTASDSGKKDALAGRVGEDTQRDRELASNGRAGELERDDSDLDQENPTVTTSSSDAGAPVQSGNNNSAVGEMTGTVSEAAPGNDSGSSQTAETGNNGSGQNTQSGAQENPADTRPGRKVITETTETVESLESTETTTTTETEEGTETEIITETTERTEITETTEITEEEPEQPESTAQEEQPESTVQEEQPESTSREEKQPEDPALLQAADAAYNEIVNAYKEILSQDSEAFRDAYEKGLYGGSVSSGADTGDTAVENAAENESDTADENAAGSEDDAAGGNAAENEDDAAGENANAAAPDVDSRINYEMIFDYFTYPGSSVFYGKNDYNADGTPELVIAIGDAEYKQVREMYTFDGQKAVRLFTDRFGLGQRTNLALLPDSTFMVRGSGGAMSGLDIICRITAEKTGLEVIAEYEYDEVANGNMDHISPSGERLTDEEFNNRYGSTTNPAENISFTEIKADT